VQRVCDFVLEVNPKFEYPHMLISTIIEGAHHQKYFSKHLPSLTDVEEGKNSIVEFFLKTDKKCSQMKKRIQFFEWDVKSLIVFCLLGSLTLSTTLDSLSKLTEDSFEILSFDWQEDTDEDKQEKKDQEEKKLNPELRISYLSLLSKIKQNKGKLFISSNPISFEIYLPPPERF